jgi:hypothetical protein
MFKNPFFDMNYITKTKEDEIAQKIIQIIF